MARVIMTVEVNTPDYTYWNPIKETLGEADSLTEALRLCDERFNVWVTRRISGELGGRPYPSSQAFLSTHRFKVVPAAPWEVRD